MGIVVQANGIKKEFGDFVLFQDLSLVLEEGEKAGLVGANGAGKTTLVRCLMQKERVEAGAVGAAPGISIGYLEQLPEIPEDQTLFSAVLDMFTDVFALRESMNLMEEQMSRLEGKALEDMMKRYGELTEAYDREEGFACEAKAKKVLFGLGFLESDFNRGLESFSGGEKTRVSLARLLVREHQFLILDEPTNHLDLASMEWLEDYLKSYKKTLLIISHDRYFLDQTTQITFFMENGRIKRYPGSYSRFLELKTEEDLALGRVREKQQKEIEALEDYIERNRAGIKSKQARGRQSRLDRMEIVQAPVRERRIALNSKNVQISRSGDKVLTLDGVSFGYPGRPLFSRLQEEVRYQERVALVGPNGAGKTTLLKLIMGQLSMDEGKIYWGSRVKKGYFDQEHGNLRRGRTVLDELIQSYSMTLQEARDHLAQFLFREDEIYKRIEDLSGGEQGRLSFLKLLLENANFLILDEPTNHLDIASREVIESFLKNYPGTILAVSHDRYFLDAIATRILEIADDGVVSYLGNYTDYKMRKAASKLQAAAVKPAKEKKKTRPAGDLARIDGDAAFNRAHKVKLRSGVQLLEKEIETAETRLQELSAVLTDAQTYQSNEAALKEIIQEYQALEKKLPLIYKDWEQAAEELAQLE
ncbi:MAG: ABC-F family ATP-binding cassette domain-containing protein [Peptococcaceae bacterium]|jgi:ATP-binding cassette subfamily F protein 3|nr:ABC-F family ATP-binding cassette domain-containing protein [Peptococcaceae bacterium]